MAHRRERPGGLAGGNLSSRSDVLGRGVEVSTQPEEVDLGEIEVHLVGTRLLAKLREIRIIEACRALELGHARPVSLRFRMQGPRVGAKGLLDRRRGRLDVLGVGLGARPRSARRVEGEGAFERRSNVRPIFEGHVAVGDREHPVARVAARRLELQKKLVSLDPALVVGLIIKLLREGAHDLAAEPLTPDFGEKRVEILGRVLLVFAEDFDHVLERLALKLVQLVSLGDAHGLARTPPLGLRIGGLEDAHEPPGRLVAVAESPVAPRALEEGEPVEGGIDLRPVREDALVLGQGPGIVGLAIEDGLGLGHMRVRDEAALGVLPQDPLEPLPRFAFFALLEGQEAVDVERQVGLVEPRVVAKNTPEEIARDAVVELGCRPALVDRPLLPAGKPVDERVAIVFPLKLAEANQRLRHLPRLARRLADEPREQRDGLGPQLFRLRHVRGHARIEPGLQDGAQRIGDSGSPDGRPARSRSVDSTPRHDRGSPPAPATSPPSRRPAESTPPRR